MEIKIVVLLLLLLCLFLNFLQEKEQFKELKGGHLHIRNVVEDEVDNMIAEAKIKHGSSDDTTTHDKLVGLKTRIEKVENGITKTYDKTHKLSLAKDKVLLTLFYDPLDKNSADFYDDTFVSEEDVVTSSPSVSNLDEVISISSKDMKPWNKLKQILNTLQDDIPYASQKFLYLEEIKCSAKKMEECHLKDLILVNRTAFDATQPYPTHTLGPQTLAEPPPRGENLVDKLPKVIFSFLKPNGLDENNQEVRQHFEIEYDGLYTMFQDNNPISMYNMIKYMRDTVDKNLEILDIDLDTPDETKDILKMIHHYKTHHKEKLDSSNIATEKEKIKNGENEPKFILLNDKKDMMPPLFNNKFIYKCKHCPMFVKTSQTIP